MKWVNLQENLILFGLFNKNSIKDNFMNNMFSYVILRALKINSI